MKLKFLEETDFINYKKPSMFVGFPTCTFKCGDKLCQNYQLKHENDLELSYEFIVNRYLNNLMTSAIVFGGLEPFDSWVDLKNLIWTFRARTQDDIVIYTGYTEEELSDKIEQLKESGGSILIKFGRYIPGDKKHYDENLGVNLASDNQYSKWVDFS